VAAKKKVLKVTAPLVQLTMGDRVSHLFEGDIVPSEAPDEWVDHHKDLGFVAESDPPAEADPPAESGK
jgi:hypothetical protein